MAKTNITDDEKSILKQYAKTSSLVLVHFKAQAILLSSKRMSDEDIADILDRKERTVILWRRNWNKTRLASIFTGHQDNSNAAKLTPTQKAEIKQTLQSPPSEIGLPKEFWEVPQLKTYVEATFGVVYESERAYHYLIDAVLEPIVQVSKHF